jgi:hypothetical protein
MGSNKRLMAGTIKREEKREGQRKAKRSITCRNQNKERVNPSHGRKLSYP